MRLQIALLLFLLVGPLTGQPGIQNTPGWTITARERANYAGIALSGGRIGIMSSPLPFRSGPVFLNNVYDRESETGVSKILEGPNFVNLLVVIDGDTVGEETIRDWKQVLDMKNATLTTSFRHRNRAEISYTVCALRGMPYAGVMDVCITPLSRDLEVTVAGEIITPGTLVPVRSSFRILRDNEIEMPLLQTVAESPFGRHTLATTATFIFGHDRPELTHTTVNAFHHRVAFSRNLERNEPYHFSWTGAVCTTGDFADPQNESERMAIFLLRGNKPAAEAQHLALWNELWESDIIIDGDPVAQQDIRLALYHLYAFSREGSRLSIAPMGLSSANYNGHIFWDTELWMFPPLLVMHDRVARTLLDYRADRLEKARQKAANFGYRGAMFPWESDDTGEEATPSWALTGTFEHHITADVGIAFWNYFRVTQDLNWLKECGYPVMKEVAGFWASRAVANGDGSYSIRNVVGANEFAPNVDDNAFTNGSARAILRYTAAAAEILAETPDPAWLEVAENLRFHYFESGVMMEHSRYNGEVIKQADVNLLAYPLELVDDPAQVLRDLAYYEPRMAPEGPAMGHSILSILHARMGHAEEAAKLFGRSYVPNKRPPFGALAESAMSNNPYFATGAGGMLQAVIFGFGGLRITGQGIEQGTPMLPPTWDRLVLKGFGPENRTYVIE